MLTVGLCGGSGSGKSTAASLFSTLGIPSLNADTLYHELTSQKTPCLDELRDAFGEGIIRDGALDRRALSRIVFADTEEARVARATLNRIAHAHVLTEARRRLAALAAQGVRVALFDAPLLFESGFDTSCDLVVCVVAEERVRIARLCERDGLTEEQARARLRAQLSDRELIARSDRVLHNSGELTDLCAEVEALAEELYRLSNEKK